VAAEPLSVRVGVGWGLFDPEPRAERLWRAVDAMEEIGYDSIWLSDTATRPDLAPLPALAAIAARTTRLKLGTGVLVVPPRNPVLLARELATIDLLSDGRLLPAAGLGIDEPAEREAMGVDGSERVARLEESLAVMRMLWTGDPVTFEGRFARLTGVRLSPRPKRRKLEIWLGGHAPKALERIGRIGDGWLGSFVSPEDFARKADAIRAAAAAANRSIDEDHYGMTLFAARAETDIPAGVRALVARRPGLDIGDSVAVSAAGLRGLLERFRAVGATKFVVFPLAADDPEGWLAELFEQAVAPVEAAH
jgi:probable F420-dependent oxidoreductase